MRLQTLQNNEDIKGLQFEKISGEIEGLKKPTLFQTSEFMQPF